MKHAILCYVPATGAVTLLGLQRCEDAGDFEASLTDYDAAAVVAPAEEGAAARLALGSSIVARRADGAYLAAVRYLNPDNAAESTS